MMVENKTVTINGIIYQYKISGRRNHEVYRYNTTTNEYDFKWWFRESVTDVDLQQIIEEDKKQLIQ